MITCTKLYKAHVRKEMMVLNVKKYIYFTKYIHY